MTRFRYRYATYSYLLFVCLIPIVTSISVDENGSKASSNPSAFDEELQLDQLSDKTYLTSSELKLFRESLNFIKDDKCRRDLNATLWGLLNNVHWAVSSKLIRRNFICCL